MKKTALLLLFCFSSFCLQAQEKAEIIPLAEEMLASVQKDYNSILDYTYPKVFDLVTREQMTALFDQMFNNDAFSINIMPAKNAALEISEVKEIKGCKYALLSYNSEMQLQFKTEIEISPNDMKNALLMSFPNAKIDYDEANNTYNISLEQKNLVISDEYTQGNWRFLNANKNDKELLKLLIDEQILNAFDL